jgi:hypothetical protein
MRIETQPYTKIRVWTPPLKGQRQATHELIPQKGFIKCPRCINGVAKQSVDAKDLVWDCVMCGWSQPMREPERKPYGMREAGSYDSKRY